MNMNQPIATFEKVSFKQWRNDQTKLGLAGAVNPADSYFEQLWRDVYDRIELPQRATAGAAGYDFHIPYSTAFRTDASIIVPTGIRVKIEPGWMLALFPRSGLGFKHGMHLKNTVGIIDSDYYYADNEGHIMAKVDVDSNFVCNEGERFMQGVFIPCGIATNDAPMQAARQGGFGSTGV